jgi:hypothetical protein
MIDEICQTLIAKMKRELFLNKEAVLKVVWYLVNCVEQLLAQSLIKEVCAIVAAEKWKKHEKYEFFNYIISDGWSKLESISKLDILNMCAALIESWIIEECKRLYTNCDFSECARFFFLIEKHRFDPSQLDISRSFEPYLEKLPLILLKDCLLNLHMLVVTTKPCIRELPVCRELFSKVCRHFVDRNFLSVYKSEDASKILNCLIWIDDDRYWKLFADKICSSFVITEEYQPFQQILLWNTSIHEAIVKSNFFFNAFIRIVDFWVSKWKSVKEPAFTWCMPKAIVPNHPEVESFLRSSQTDFYYHIRSKTSLKLAKNSCPVNAGQNIVQLT